MLVVVFIIFFMKNRLKISIFASQNQKSPRIKHGRALNNSLRVEALYSFVIVSVCCLHGERDNDTSKTLLCFSESSLATCQEVLKIRKSNPELKCSNVELPQTIPSRIDYHKDCYKRFIASSAKYRDSVASNWDRMTESSTRSTTKPLKYLHEYV